MRTWPACFVLVVICSVNRFETGDDRAKKQLQNDNYTVTWGTAPAFEPEAELEIGDGSGHGGTLGWVRSQPGKVGVDVLSIQFDEGWHPYKSKWPPDRAPVTVKRARLKLDAYAALLRDLAVVDSAKLKPVERNGFTFSSNDFWVYARLATDKKMLLELNWVGYEGFGGRAGVRQAAGRLAREAIKRARLRGQDIRGVGVQVLPCQLQRYSKSSI